MWGVSGWRSIMTCKLTDLYRGIMEPILQLLYKLNNSANTPRETDVNVTLF